MIDSDTITIYWSNTASTSNISWSQLYASPKHVFNEHRKNKNLGAGDGSFFACPAMSNMFTNIYKFPIAIDDEVTLPDRIDDRVFEDSNFFNMFNDPSNFFEIPGSNSKVSAQNFRNSSLVGHYNITYNLSWIFFCDESVNMRITAPYFPTVTPAEGVMLAPGEFDIGSWFRPYNLDYHIPFGTKKLVFKEGDPLFYGEFKTDKKVVLKRFKMNDALQGLMEECVQSPRRYGRFKKLADRYKTSRNAMIPELVLSEIKKNLID